ncbi:MAG: hypothetical protein N2039_15330 [Gemmataceae bacterium]|nr:hypothetical protein [Gemmataceae bacterium]
MANPFCGYVFILLCLAPADDKSSSSPAKQSNKPSATSGKSSSLAQTTQKGNKPTATGQKSTPAPNEKIDNLWTMDPDKMKTPKDGLVGRLGGEPFRPDQVQFENQVLTFRSGKEFLADQEVIIFLFADLKELTAKPMLVKPKRDFGDLAPHVHVHSKRKAGQAPDIGVYTDKYAMKLELKPEKDGQLRGTIHLCLPDDAKSFLAGTFTVTGSKEMQPAANPVASGTISGSIRMPLPEKRTLVTLVVHGVDSKGKGLSGGSVGINVRRGETSIGSSGDIDLNFAGNSNPTYVFNAKGSGTYLVVLCVDRIPVAWKWVEWNDGQPASADLEVSKDDFGSLEVRLGSTDQNEVRVLPLWEGDQAPAGVGDGTAMLKRFGKPLQGWMATVTAGRASVNFPKLMPGRYRVFAGQRYQDVEIQPGRPAKVELK